MQKKWGDCRNDRLGLHDLVPSERYKDEVSHVVDVCTLCGEYKSYRLIDGKMDNDRYFEDHLREFCQPYGATHDLFLELHGHNGIDRAIKHLEGKQKAKELREEFTPEIRDIVKTLKRTSVYMAPQSVV